MFLHSCSQLFTLAVNANKFNVFRGLFNGKQVNTLNDQTLLSVIEQQAAQELGQACHLFILHDLCDIRKPYAHKMEHIGKVLDLNKRVINGYKTMNSVGLDLASKDTVQVLYHHSFSTEHPDFISQATVAASLKEPHPLNQVEQGLFDRIQAGDYTNTEHEWLTCFKSSHTTLRQANPDAIITHVVDREGDNELFFNTLSTLDCAGKGKSEFIIRLKANRVSDQSEPIILQSGKVSKRSKALKLISKKFAHQGEFEIARLRIKGKFHTKVRCIVAYETVKIGDQRYSVVRATLLNASGQMLYDVPLLLLSNRVLSSPEDAFKVYQQYLLRFKIEVVFKSLKEHLGWESFQIRDYHSIKNLLALAFYLIGYYPTLRQQIQDHEQYKFLAMLGGGKGKVSIRFVLRGLVKVDAYITIQQQIERGETTHQEVVDTLAKHGRSNS